MRKLFCLYRNMQLRSVFPYGLPCLRKRTHEAVQPTYIRKVTLRAHSECESWREGKEYVDSSVDFNRIPIEEGGLIPPLFNSVNGSRYEIGWPANRRNLGDRSVGFNDHVKSNGALDTIMFRSLRINRLDFVDKLCRLHVSRRSLFA
jgi:hypothetical protein